jgi:hypothetical protein
MATKRDEINNAIEEENKAEQEWRNYELPPNASTSQFNKKKSLEKKWKDAQSKRKKLEAPLKELEKNLERVQKSIKQASEVAKTPESEAAAKRELARLRGEQTKLSASIAEYSGVKPVTRTVGENPIVSRALQKKVETAGAKETVVESKDTTKKNETVIKKDGKKPKPVATTTQTTPTPAAPAQETVEVGGKKVVVGGQQWKQIIQEEFGSLWDVYSSNPDVQKVIDESVKGGYFNDEIQMSAKLQNTGWYRTTAQATRQFNIRMSTDPATLESQINQTVEALRQSTLSSGITFTDATLRKLATDKIKFGWSAQQEQNAIGSEAVSEAQLRGAQGIADLRTGTVARGLREKAAAYAQKPSEALIDTWTQEIMTGKKTATNWEDLMRDSARTQFRSLQPALDKGQDVETALYAYKQQATRTLGSAVDTSEIDWTSDKWNKALNYRDEKTNEYRQMDLWEWNKYLRTLPEWQDTDEAKDTYRNVAFSLAQGFGRMA